MRSSKPVVIAPFVIAAAAAIGIAAAAIGIVGAPQPARAATSTTALVPTALVIGNGTYTSLPALSGCLLSAHAVSAALRNAGFNVVEREDTTSGGIDAAINEAAQDLANHPGGPAFVYVCALVTSYNGRPFLLPTSANIARPTDALTQGLLAKSMLDLLTRSGNRSSVLALDVAPAPGAPATLGLDSYAQGSLPDELGYVAVIQVAPTDAVTPLAAALVAHLKAPTVQVAPLLDAVQQQLAGNKAATIAAVRTAAAGSYLVGAPAPPPAASIAPAPKSPPTASSAAPAAAPLAAAAAAAPPAPEAAPSQAALPDDAAMTDADRRRVQTTLARLGYYDGQVDGIFGPDTRAAIRRFQHEIHVEMTGRLTTEQATRLVGDH